MKIIKSINIEKELWELLDKISKQENRSKSNMIEKLIKDYTRQK